MDRAFFIGQSPLQVLNLVEAAREYRMAGPLLVVYDDEAIRRQIASLLERLGVSDVRFQRRHLLFRTLFPVWLLLRYARLHGRVDTVFFGTWTTWASFLVHLLAPQRHVLVDDGHKTINLLVAPATVGLGRRRGGPFSRDYVETAELFTFYDDLARRHGRSVRPNRLASVAGQLMAGGADAVAPAGPDDILFIGTNATDSYERFDEAMAQVRQSAGTRRFVYLMHRRDPAERIAALAAQLGFEAHRFDMPLELVFHHLWSRHRPAVWTFGSTATDTLQAMEPTLHVRVFRFEKALFRTARVAEAYDGIYAHYAASPRVELLPLPGSVPDSARPG